MIKRKIILAALLFISFSNNALCEEELDFDLSSDPMAPSNTIEKTRITDLKLQSVVFDINSKKLCIIDDFLYNEEDEIITKNEEVKYHLESPKTVICLKNFFK